MSINHYSQDLQEAIWWNTNTDQHHPQFHTQPPFMQDPHPSKHSKLLNLDPQFNCTSWSYQQQQHQQHLNNYFNHPTPTTTHLDFDLNNRGDDAEDPVGQVFDDSETLVPNKPNIPREPMFEKPLTPSDVGKLNRLVIPKQHAEKYFPLSGDSCDKGLLLSFEDESGKCWRFRYSYWSSSQSYVLTKGWSRYVREKRLDAGDIVFFERHRVDSDRLFIGWRRRGAVQDGSAVAPPVGGGEDWRRGVYGTNNVASRHHTGSTGQNLTVSSGNLKRLRLFGVNLDCQLDDSAPTTPEGSSLSSQHGPPNHLHHRHHFYSYPHFQDSHNHMDMTLYQDRRG